MTETNKPISCIILGMAGSGKTTLMKVFQFKTNRK